MKMEWFHAVYDSIEDYYKASDRDGQQFGMSWSQVRDPGELKMLVEQGWQQGVVRARRMQLDMDEHVQTLGLAGMLPIESYDVSGASVDVGLFCEGEPECMVEYEEQMMPRSRVVRMVVQINYRSNVDATAALRRGAAIAAIVDALEAGGLQCELWAVDCTNSDDAPRKKENPYLLRMACLVKHPGEPMPLDRIAFALGHPAFYRAISFGVRTAIQGHFNGNSQPIPKDIRDEGELIVPLLTHRDATTTFGDDESAAKWACDTFAKLVTQAQEEIK